MLKTLLRLLLGIGFVGFLAPFLLLPRLGDGLDWLELPTRLQTSSIRLPDGAVLTASEFAQRLQRYDASGRFEKGWFVPARGGAFGIGVSTGDEIVVCSARGHEAVLFTLDGRPSGTIRPCSYGRSPGWSGQAELLGPGKAALAGITLRAPVSVSLPPPSLIQWLLLPLWNPMVAWAMMLLGGLLLNWFYPQPKHEAWFQMGTKLR